MPDLGTMGNALSRSPPPPPGMSADANPNANADPGTDEGPIGGGSAVKALLRQRKVQMDAIGGRIRNAEDASAALKPPEMVPAPKAPEQQNTPLSERWGSAAMLLAAFGGLLTQTPLTASLNAMAKVNEAYNAGDAEAAKNAYAVWKVENENAIKMNEFHNKAYESALKKIGSDYTGATAEARIMAVSLKDNVALSLFDAGRPDDAMRLLGARGRATAKMTAASYDLALRDQDMKDFQQTFQTQNGRPPNAQEMLKRWNSQPKETDAAAKPEGPGVAAEEDTKILADAQFKKDHGGRAPGPDDEPAMATIRRTLRNEGKTEGKPDQYGPATLIKVTGEDGKQQEVLAQQDKTTSGWVTADETRTPIKGAAGSFRIAKPDKAPTLSGLDAAEVQRLVTDEHLSEPEARKRVTEGKAADTLSILDTAEVKRLVAGGMTETEAHRTVRDRPISASTQLMTAVSKDIRSVHADWTDGQIATAASKQITEARQPVMNDDAADLNARIALKIGHAPTSMGRSQANVAKFQDAYARVAHEQGMNADAIAANQVKFIGEMSESRALGTTSARVDFGAHELDVALPQALELSEKVYRPGFKSLAEIQQALQGQTSDPDLLEFAQQNQAVMNAYALAMNRGGLSTVSSMDRAEKLLQTATSQGGYMRQIDRLHKEVQTILYGTAAAKQSLMNEITGGTTQVPQPKLTNVPRPGESGGPKEGDTAPSKSGKPMIFRGGTWQYQQ